MADLPNIVEFVTDPRLLNLSLSEPQEVLLRAIYGLPLSDSQLDVFYLCTGRHTYTPHGFSEATILCGARAGKDSRIACPIASYEAALGGHEKALTRGERAIVPLVAQDTRGTRIAFGYLKSHFLESPDLRTMLEDEPTLNEIRLINRVSIICFPSTAPSLRGWSNPVALMDELGFWRLEGSTDSDVEIQASIRRGMINFDRTRLIKISTPYMKSGLLYDDFKNHFGQDSPDLLVWRASSTFMNPTLKPSRLEREKRLDPVRFSREYEAEFAEDLESFLPAAWIEQAIVRDRHELAPREGIEYSAGCDATGLSDSPTADVFALCIGHREDGAFVQDVCRGWKKTRQQSMDLEGIVNEIAAILSRYGLNDLYGDRYSGQWVVEAFRKAGITYFQTESDKSYFYLEMEPLFAQGKISLLDHPELERELKLLERRPRQGGKVLVDHPRGRHDDHANALAISVEKSAENLKAARGFSSSLHVSKQRLSPGRGPIFIGQTLVDCPATVIAEEERGAISVLATFASEGMSLGRHFEQTVRPWLSRNANFVFHERRHLLGSYEQTDQWNLLEILEEFGGTWEPSVNSWESRRDQMLDCLGKSLPYVFGPALTIDPVDGRLLIEALSGRWSYEKEARRDRRNLWWYVANAFSLVIDRIAPNAPKVSPKPIEVHGRFDPRSFSYLKQ